MNSKYTSIFLFLLTGLLLQTCIRDEVLAPPSLAPLSKALWMSGDVLTINGANFDPLSTKIFIDEAEVRPAGAVTNSVINVIVPITTESKIVSLYVQTKFGTTSSVSFTLLPPLPGILKVIPDKAGPGKRIKLHGTNLGSVKSVSFKTGSGPPANASFLKIANDTLQVTVPKDAGFDASDIILVTDNGSSSPASFTILHPPVIDSFSPTGGGVAGSTVQVNGHYLTALLNIRIGSQKLEVISGSASVVIARIGATVNSDTIHISTWGGDAKSATKFNMAPAPVITAFDRPSGIAGTLVTITGTSLTGAFDVRFGNITTDIISNTGTTIKVSVPVGATTAKVSVTSAAGTGISAIDFIVPGGPLISDFAPATGVAGTKVTINGLNFGASDVTPHSIKIGSLALTNVVWSDVKIEGNIPTGAVTGKMIIVTPNGMFETAGNFLISGSPQILSFTPQSGVAGTTVTITGSNMGTVPDVRFNSIKATTITKATPTEIICVVPANASTGKISVNNALSATDFTISPSPVIKSISLSRGPVNAEVIITGEFLSGATVQFANNVIATKVGSDTDTQLKVKVPIGAVTGKITVTNTIGSSSSASNFEVLAAPTLTSFTPASGIVGLQVTISGTNLQYNPVVRFGAITAVVRSINSTQLIVEVPAGATDGKISVSTDGTLAPVLSVANFDVIGAPVITSLSPTSAATGATVAINGTDFNNLQSLTFDGLVINTFVSKTVTKIEFIVPILVAANYTHSINVSVKTSTGTSSNSTFSYIGPPTINPPSPGTNPATWATLVTGSGLLSISKITINGATAVIDYKADNALTMRVPSTAATGAGSMRLYYTTENFVSLDYTVLVAPPPGVFPPPQIVIPPPPPGGFVPVNVNADWPDAYESLHWFRIDAKPGSFVPDPENGQPLSYNTSGQFTIVEHYDGFDSELENLLEGNSGSGRWSRSTLYFQLSDGRTYSGQYNQGFQMVFTDNETGHQLVLGSPCPNFPNCK